MVWDKKSKTALITIILSLIILGLLWFLSEEGYREGYNSGYAAGYETGITE